MASANLAILIKATDMASAVFEKVGGSAEKTGFSFRAAFAAAGALGAGAAGALADMAREGAADAASMEAVRIAVENAGGSWDDAEGTVSAFIDRMRDTRAVADDALKPALASLVATTGDYERSMTLASLAMDVARGKNIDLNTAATLVGKVAMGNTSALTRYGIVLGENATASEALAELQKRFAGQAEAYGSTTKGQLEILSLKIGDFREQIGQSLGPAMGFVAMLPGLSTGFVMVSGAASGLLPILGLLRTALMVQVIPAIGATVIALAPILLPIAAIGLAIGLMALAWSQNWGDVQGKTEAVVGAVKSVMDTIGPVVERVWTGAVETVRSAINNIIQAINRLIGAWNAIEFTVPRIEVPSVGPIQGFSLGGFTIGTPDVGLIPLLDRGGIVTRPTIALLAANRRPEAILPLGANGSIPIDYGRLAAAMARQPIIVQMDRREVGRMVREELLALGRQNLSVGLA